MSEADYAHSRSHLRREPGSGHPQAKFEHFAGSFECCIDWIQLNADTYLVVRTKKQLSREQIHIYADPVAITVTRLPVYKVGNSMLEHEWLMLGLIITTHSSKQHRDVAVKHLIKLVSITNNHQCASLHWMVNHLE